MGGQPVDVNATTRELAVCVEPKVHPPPRRGDPG